MGYLFLQNICAERCGSAGETAVLHLEFDIVDFITVGAVGQTGGQIYKIGFRGNVDYGSTFFTAVYKENLPVVAYLHIFGLSIHVGAEMVDRNNFRMEELVVAARTKDIVAPVVLAGGVHGT